MLVLRVSQQKIGANFFSDKRYWLGFLGFSLIAAGATTNPAGDDQKEAYLAEIVSGISELQSRVIEKAAKLPQPRITGDCIFGREDHVINPRSNSSQIERACRKGEEMSLRLHT